MRGEGRIGGLPTSLLARPPSSPSPHCRFIHDWVYSGVFRDVYGEFMIQVNQEYLGFRGRWRLSAGPGPTPSGGSGLLLDTGQPCVLFHMQISFTGPTATFSFPKRWRTASPCS